MARPPTPTAPRSRATGRSQSPAAAEGEVRIGPVAAIPAVLKDMGIKPGAPFARAGVARSTFANPENRIAFESLGRLFAECAKATGCEHFGLLVGERFDLTGLGAIGYLMRNSSTVGEALRALLLHLNLHDRGAVPILLNMERSRVLLGYSIYRHGIPGSTHLYDAAIAIGYRALKEICGAAWNPVRVKFSHKRPDDPNPYHRVLGPRVRFDAEVSGIEFASSWLDHPVAGADAGLRDLVMQAITQTGGHSTTGFADAVRSALHQMVLSGTASAPNVAFLFGIHERTLRKRLTAERTTLQHLVSQTRFELAKQLLENTNLPLSEIAAALKYADLAVFSRAFRNWSGTSASDWRAGRGQKVVASVNAR